MNQQLVIKLTSGDETGVPVGLVESPPMLYTNLKALFPSVTFSDIATPSETEPYWYGVFEWKAQPTEVPHDKNIEELGLLKGEDGIWRPEFRLVDATPEQIQERTEAKSIEVRGRRNNRLKRSDWVELPKFNLSVEEKSKYDIYRQALRDLPQQTGFPWNITWPDSPENKEA